MTGPAASGPRAGPGERAALALLLAWLAVRLAWLAWHADPSLPPDEWTHFGRCQLYAAVPGRPSDGPATAAFGVLADRPYLYYWLMGRVLALNVTGLPDLLVLRLANAVLGVLAAVAAHRLALRLCADARLRLLFVLAWSNTLMLTGLFAAVSYDNLTNLLALASLWAFVASLREPRPAALALFALCLLAGALTKRTFLPLAAILVALWLLRCGRRLPAVARDLRRALAAPGWRTGALAGLAALALLANAALYGGNLVRYGKLVPDLAQVVGPEVALENRIYARDHIAGELRAGRITYAEALRRGAALRHPSDRRDLRRLLAEARADDGQRIGPARYAWRWLQLMTEGIFGYYGHRRVVPGPARLAPVYLAGALGLVGLLALRRRGDPTVAVGTRADLLCCAAIAGLYALLLGAAVHHPLYLRTGSLGLGVQGRYLFPVLGALYAALGAGLFALARSPRVRAALAAVVALWFLQADLPYLWWSAPSGWWVGVGG